MRSRKFPAEAADGFGSVCELVEGGCLEALAFCCSWNAAMRALRSTGGTGALVDVLEKAVCETRRGGRTERA